MTTWPNNEDWHALREGTVTIDGKRFALSVVECGELYLPTGKLVACDPFAAMTRGGNPVVHVPKGRFPVVVTIADVSEQQDGSHSREAYASLILGQTAEARRAALVPLRGGEEPPELDEGEYVGFPVDAGTACFVDDAALEYGMPPSGEWLDGLFENDDPASWFNRMDDPDHIRAGIADIRLPLADDGANLILFHSGWGDGVYPLVGGYDPSGELVAVHIDFHVLFAIE